MSKCNYNWAKSITMIAFMVCCTYLEVKADGAGALWTLLVLWIIFGTWHSCNGENEGFKLSLKSEERE